jgi:hypothetical protein
MAFLGKLDEATLKDHWVKKLLKTYDPGPLAELMEERIKWPSTGPSRPYNSSEQPTDIINALVSACPPNEFRKKLEPAVGLMLWKLMHNKLHESSDMITGVFNMIRVNRFTECSLLLRKWLNEKPRYLTASYKVDRDMYYTAMLTFADVQPQDKEIEEYWMNIWKNCTSSFYDPAFYGLRWQNPEVAVDEHELLLKRNTSYTAVHLVGLWRNIRSRATLERTIAKGLHQENKYAARILNLMLTELNEDDKTELMANLQSQPLLKDQPVIVEQKETHA